MSQQSFPGTASEEPRMLTQMWSLAYRLSIRLGETASIAQSRKVIYFSDSYAVITASEILSIMIVNFSWSVGRRYSISPRQVPPH
jgi:hypothetical protein